MEVSLVGFGSQWRIFKERSQGSELIVDNKVTMVREIESVLHRLVSTRLFSSFRFVRPQGVMSGIEGYTSVYHATVSEGLAEISNLPMVQNQWHHLASVVDKDAGTLRHYLNGALVAESFFSSVSRVRLLWEIGFSEGCLPWTAFKVFG